MKIVLLLLVAAGIAAAQSPGVFVSRYAKADFALTADPNAAQWKNAPSVIAEKNPRGEVVPGHRTEIRSRWTDANLYLLFICPYEQLHLHPNPQTAADTNKLWDWDVAEAFLGSDFENINLYKEFELSPQGEWVDLDIDRQHMNGDKALLWNSGWTVKARIDEAKKIWYGEMQIPIKSLTAQPAKPGLELRANFYRCQAPPPRRIFLTWQPTGNPSFHTPSRFGILRLEK